MPVIRGYAPPTVDNPDAGPLHFDLAINEHQEIIGTAPIFGMQGKFDDRGTAECYPFVLYVDGKLDFGTNHDRIANDRLVKLDLRDGPIREGRILTLLSSYGVKGILKFRIKRITGLL